MSYGRCPWEVLCPEGWVRCQVRADQEKHQQPHERHWWGPYSAVTWYLEELLENADPYVRRTPVLCSREASEE